MTSNKTKLLDPGLCRCCKSIKKCRLLTAEYSWMGKKEVYTEMIVDCFGLVLSYLDGEDKDKGICATCVARLREASSFRTQVLQCEETFLGDKLKESDDDAKVTVKLEPKDNDTNEIIDNDNGPSCSTCSDDDTKDPNEFPEVTESNRNNVKVKQASKSKTTSLKKLAKRKSLKVISRSAKEDLITKSDVKNNLKRPLIKKKILAKMKRDSELREYINCTDPHYMAEDNIITILENSYVYPFKNRSNNLYCFYCKEFFSRPEDLREHTAKHDPKSFKKNIRTKKYYYVDVTRVDCRLCTEKINDINTFKSHITQVHSKEIHRNVPDCFIEFRLTFTDLVCCVCQQVYFDFNGVVKHMVDHFSNYTCDICGLCFLEEYRLQLHMRSHKEEEKHPCEVCGKIFKSKFYKDTHVDTIHNKIPSIHCPKCDEMFLRYTQRNKHLVEVHNVHKSYPCNMCDKVYDIAKTLTEHQRRTHMKVLKHRCDYCYQRFYLPSRLKEHLATHTGERNVYKCDHCDKSYPRLKSLQEHLKVHSLDGCRCHMCGQTFGQNSALKNHVKLLHPECDIEGFF